MTSPTHLSAFPPILLPVAGLVLGVLLSARLAPRRGIAADRGWGISLTFVLTAVLSARLLVIAFHLHDFLQHPFWMLGLTAVREPLYTFAALLLGFAAACGYLTAWRLPARALADVLAPGAAAALAIASLPPIPLPHQPLLATLAFPLLHLAGFAIALFCFQRTKSTGRTALCWLLSAGLGSMAVEQLLPLPASTWLLAGSYSLLDLVAISGLLLAAVLWRTGAVTSRS